MHANGSGSKKNSLDLEGAKVKNLNVGGETGSGHAREARRLQRWVWVLASTNAAMLLLGLAFLAGWLIAPKQANQKGETASSTESQETKLDILEHLVIAQKNQTDIQNTFDRDLADQRAIVRGLEIRVEGLKKQLEELRKEN